MNGPFTLLALMSMAMLLAFAAVLGAVLGWRAARWLGLLPPIHIHVQNLPREDDQ